MPRVVPRLGAKAAVESVCGMKVRRLAHGVAAATDADDKG